MKTVINIKIAFKKVEKAQKMLRLACLTQNTKQFDFQFLHSEPLILSTIINIQKLKQQTQL